MLRKLRRGLADPACEASSNRKPFARVADRRFKVATHRQPTVHGVRLAPTGNATGCGDCRGQYTAKRNLRVAALAKPFDVGRSRGASTAFKIAHDVTFSVIDQPER